MSKFFYSKLAASNIKKNGKTYVPYILTCIFTIAMFYIMRSLSLNEGMTKMVGGDSINYSMQIGCKVTGFFSLIFLFYTNSFLMKQRKKEFGIFNILGMEKRHISKVVAMESLYIMTISLVVGILVGILLDKIMYLVILKVLGYKITLGFYISQNAILTTIILFSLIFLLIFFNSVFQIHLSKPIELLQGSNTSEKEPKTKWIMAILGGCCLGGGYYISVTTVNPITAIVYFLGAIILVIIGTYFLFIAGSIALLKLLRRNKKYYYKTKHFISISGMIYRMKQNAVGLANICILSTMVLVMVSSTTSMMMGLKDIIHTRYPYDIIIYSKQQLEEQNKKMAAIMQNAVSENGLEVKNKISYHYLNFAGLKDGNTFITNHDTINITNNYNASNLFFVPLEDYNLITGQNRTLENGEVMLYSNQETFKYNTLKVFDREYNIVERIEAFLAKGIASTNIVDSHFIVVKDMTEVKHIYKQQKSVYGELASNIYTYYGFDTTGDEKTKLTVYNQIIDSFIDAKFDFTIENKMEANDSFLSIYGGLFFLSIFLGTLFIMATILIIYYKQISEGYDDKERFEIMQKVGLSHAEVKKAIHSQILTVFFLPLVMAGIHMAFAFPVISKILKVLNMTNTFLFILCTICCFFVFAVLYGIIYSMTAKVYYRIVSRGRDT